MRKLYFPLFFFSALSVSALAQTPQTGSPNPNLPANLSEPALTPAQPAHYSSVPASTVGQFYVKDDKPVSPTGQPLLPQTAAPGKTKLPPQTTPQQPAPKRAATTSRN